MMCKSFAFYAKKILSNGPSYVCTQTPRILDSANSFFNVNITNRIYFSWNTLQYHRWQITNVGKGIKGSKKFRHCGMSSRVHNLLKTLIRRRRQHGLTEFFYCIGRETDTSMLPFALLPGDVQLETHGACDFLQSCRSSSAAQEARHLSKICHLQTRRSIQQENKRKKKEIPKSPSLVPFELSSMLYV